MQMLELAGISEGLHADIVICTCLGDFPGTHRPEQEDKSRSRATFIALPRNLASMPSLLALPAKLLR